MHIETLNSVLGLLGDFECPVYYHRPDNRVQIPGDDRALNNDNNPIDPRITRILVHLVANDFDPRRSLNQDIDYVIDTDSSSAQIISWPQPRTLRYQIEFRGFLEKEVNDLEETMLRQFKGGDAFDMQITWTVSGHIVSESCGVFLKGEKDLTTTYNAQRRIRKMVIIEVESWLWTDQDPSEIPLIDERVLHRGFEVDGEDIRYTENLEE